MIEEIPKEIDVWGLSNQMTTSVGNSKSNGDHMGTQVNVIVSVWYTLISVRGKTKLEEPGTGNKMLEKMGSSILGSFSVEGCSSEEKVGF